jgi:hypothetical protein
MIVDSHVHLGDIVSCQSPDVSIKTLLSVMDELGIDLAINIMHMLGLADCYEEAFKASESAYEQSAHRLPYALFYSPHYREASLEWIAAARGRSGYVGIKIHPAWHLTYPDDPRYERIWQVAAEHGVPIVTHSWIVSDYNPSQKFATPDRFQYYVERFPHVNLILGHAGGRYEGHLMAVNLVKRFPNVYVDLAGDLLSFNLIEWLVAQIGATRILFGSDVSMMDQRSRLAAILDADITAEEKRQILGENACRLFGLGAEKQ